jgi:hypothetical protein
VIATVDVGSVGVSVVIDSVISSSIGTKVVVVTRIVELARLEVLEFILEGFFVAVLKTFFGLGVVVVRFCLLLFDEIESAAPETKDMKNNRQETNAIRGNVRIFSRLEFD